MYQLPPPAASTRKLAKAPGLTVKALLVPACVPAVFVAVRVNDPVFEIVTLCEANTPFVKMQLLVPGETAAPGTASGKTGTPTAQTAGTAFTVTVRAVDANWNLVSSTHTVAISSSDTNATLPANAALVAGSQTFSVTLNTAGTATVTATNITDGTKTPNTSPSITVNAGALSNFLVEAAGSGNWYNAAWLYRKKITIDNTKVGSGGVTNFPVLISLTDTGLQSNAQADGDDILFTSSDGTTKLSHEIEKYVSATGQLIAWVKVPSISSAAPKIGRASCRERV